MPRIRTIKPEFPQSESMGRVSRDARLLFIQLWTLADDSGRLRGNSRMLASLLYPYDDDAGSLMDGWLSELVSEGCVRLYKAEGQTYAEICNWLNHQKIDKPSQSKIPAFDESSRILANHREPSALDQGRERIKEKEIGKERSGAAAPNKGTRLPPDWQLTADLKKAGSDARHAAKLPPIDYDTEAERFRDYWHAQAGAKGVKTDWLATWRNWCRNSRSPAVAAAPRTEKTWSYDDLVKAGAL